MSQAETVTVRVESQTTPVPGRALSTARNHHFIVDEPACAGGLEEEITPVEASWTRQSGLIHENVTCIESLHVGFEFRGLTEAEAQELVEAFKGR